MAPRIIHPVHLLPPPTCFLMDISRLQRDPSRAAAAAHDFALNRKCLRDHSPVDPHRVQTRLFEAIPDMDGSANQQDQAKDGSSDNEYERHSGA